MESFFLKYDSSSSFQRSENFQFRFQSFIKEKNSNNHQGRLNQPNQSIKARNLLLALNNKYFYEMISNQNHIGQICFFDHQFDTFTYGNEDCDYNPIDLLILQCKIYRCGYQKPLVKGQFYGKISSKNINSSLIIDFCEANNLFQIIGSIHSCLYNFNYQPKAYFQGNFQEFCESYPQHFIETLIQFLLEQIDQANIAFNNFLKEIGCNQQARQKNPSRSSIQSYLKRKRKSINQENLIKQQAALIQNTQIGWQGKKGFSAYKPKTIVSKRRTSKWYSLKKIIKENSNKIFTNRQYKQFENNITITQFQQILNESCGVLYSNWTKNIAQILTYTNKTKNPLSIIDKFVFLHLSPKGSEKEKVQSQKNDPQKIVQHLLRNYKKEFKNVILENFIRYDGDWYIDLFSHESQDRENMAKKLRQPELNYDNNLNLKFFNANLFSSYRPIFFQQKAKESPRKIYNFGSFFEKFQQIMHSEKKYEIKKNKIHLIILVHGFGASRFDMRLLQGEIKRYYYEKIKQIRIIISTANQNKTQESLNLQGIRFSKETEQQIGKIGIQNIDKISFIGHSLGGVIIRCALPRLEVFSAKFYSFITFSSPHLGFNSPGSKLIQAGIWILNNWKKTDSIVQLKLADKQNQYETELYKLSCQPGLQWFQKITFFSSKQDLIIPFYSARLQKCKNPAKNRKRIAHSKDKIKQKIIRTFTRDKYKHPNRNYSPPRQNNIMYQKSINMEENSEKYVKQKTKIHNQMCQNIIDRIRKQNKCHSFKRIQVSFEQPEQNLDSLVGRAAHLSFITSFPFLRMFCNPEESYIF